jgi:hypothetical protein
MLNHHPEMWVKIAAFTPLRDYWRILNLSISIRCTLLSEINTPEVFQKYVNGIFVKRFFEIYKTEKDGIEVKGERRTRLLVVARGEFVPTLAKVLEMYQNSGYGLPFKDDVELIVLGILAQRMCNHEELLRVLLDKQKTIFFSRLHPHVEVQVKDIAQDVVLDTEVSRKAGMILIAKVIGTILEDPKFGNPYLASIDGKLALRFFPKNVV